MIADITLGQAWGYVLALAAALVTLSKAWDIIVARIKPNKELRKKVEEHSQMLAKGSQQFSEIKAELQEQRDATAFLLRMDVALLNHFIDGNSTEAMKRTRDAVTEYLSQRR